jgi:hypothetical protein
MFSFANFFRGYGTRREFFSSLGVDFLGRKRIIYP